MLSTRPEKFLGKRETWDFAEARLREALTNFMGNDWEVDEGGGAFYGPKIDITIQDALKREFQCATIQLDYQLPLNFKLDYMTDKVGTKHKEAETPAEKVDKPEGAPASDELAPGRARPVMIHRAIIGSFERFFGIIIEHFGGKWPFWLSPRQVLIVPIMTGAYDYAEEPQHILQGDKLNVDIDVSGNTLQKKIRNGQLAQYNFIFGKFCSSRRSPFRLGSPLTSVEQLSAPRRRRPALSTSVTATTQARRPREVSYRLTKFGRSCVSSVRNVV